MKEIPQNVSESTRKRNPHLYTITAVTGVNPLGKEMTIITSETKKRIRQSSKPLMNKLEQRLFDKLCEEHKPIYPQAITFKLANGVRYTPDIFCFEWDWKLQTRSVAWEVKGPWMTDDSIVKIKVFAAAYPSIVVLLSSEDKDTGFWTFQEVYP